MTLPIQLSKGKKIHFQKKKKKKKRKEKKEIIPLLTYIAKM